MRTDRAAVTKRETGRNMPTVTTLAKLAEVTGNRLEIYFIPTSSPAGLTLSTE